MDKFKKCTLRIERSYAKWLKKSKFSKIIFSSKYF